MSKFITLTEIINKNDKPSFQPMIMNTAFILGVTQGDFHQKEDGVHIIGQSKIESVRLIQLSVGRPVFVKETMDEILALLSPDEEPTK